MRALFLSASVPQVGRGSYHESADPFLIQTAVRELTIAVIRDYRIVWGGHPSITPMIWAICEYLGVDYADRVLLYQSKFFQNCFPEENERFGNVVYVEAVEGDEQASLKAMREAMLGRDDLVGAVFIGGMEGVEVEFEIFRRLQPLAGYLIVSAPGGAARQLAEKLNHRGTDLCSGVNFVELYQTTLASPSQVEALPEFGLEEAQRALSARIDKALMAHRKSSSVGLDSFGSSDLSSRKRKSFKLDGK